MRWRPLVLAPDLSTLFVKSYWRSMHCGCLILRSALPALRPDHLHGVPLPMDMHLRNLGLLHRLAPGKACDSDIAADWGAAVQVVALSARSLLFPALAQLSFATPGAPPRAIVPDSLKKPGSEAPSNMLYVMLLHDWYVAQEQQQRQQQHVYSVGREQQAQWLTAAEAAAQTLQLLTQTALVSRCSLLLPDEGRWVYSTALQPCPSCLPRPFKWIEC
jgi:hypothetical protein